VTIAEVGVVDDQAGRQSCSGVIVPESPAYDGRRGWPSCIASDRVLANDNL
jgi:hypothetical protein